MNELREKDREECIQQVMKEGKRKTEEEVEQRGVFC